jgi:hypothetical protein
MARVLDLVEVAANPERGDAAWLVRLPEDCGSDRGCAVLHEEYVTAYVHHGERVGGPVLTLLVQKQHYDPTISVYVRFHGAALVEFLDDLDELRRVVGR